MASTTSLPISFAVCASFSWPCSSFARPMKMADRSVNTYAWMKLTSTSIRSMNIEKISDTTVEAPPATGLMACLLYTSDAADER